jgi:hypothetical protein
MVQSKVKKDLEARGIDQNILKGIIDDVLSTKKDETLGFDYLCDKHGLGNRRTLRKYVEVARKLFKAPIASVVGGYKKANDWNDYKSTFYVLVKHAITTIQTQNAVRKEFAERMNLSLFDQSIFNTEFEDIIRAVDQYKEKA